MPRRSIWQTEHWTYLQAVYALTEGADTNGVAPAVVIEQLSLHEDAADLTLEFLIDAGVVVWPAKGKILLTELGATMARERTLKTGDEAIRST